jgi:hypothetical protein
MHRLLESKPERDGPLRNSGCRWEDKIKTDLRRTGV